MPATLFDGKQPDTLKIPHHQVTSPRPKELLKEAGKPGGFRDQDDRLPTGDKGRAEGPSRSRSRRPGSRSPSRPGRPVRVSTPPSADVKKPHRHPSTRAGARTNPSGSNVSCRSSFDGPLHQGEGQPGPTTSIFPRRRDHEAGSTRSRAMTDTKARLPGPGSSSTARSSPRLPPSPVLVRRAGRWCSAPTSRAATARTSFGGQLDYATVGSRNPAQSGN